jgi:hypothetical protein
MGWAGSLGSNAQQRGANAYLEYVQIRRDGTPVVIRSSRTGVFEASVRDLEGNVLPQRTALEMLSQANLPVRIETSGAGTWISQSGYGQIAAFQDFGRHYWYLVPGDDSESTAYFVGFSRDTNNRAGYLGAGGFQSVEPAASESFRLPSKNFASYVTGTQILYDREPNVWSEPDAESDLPGWTAFLVSGDEVLAVDLRERTVRPIFRSPAIESIGVFQRPAAPQAGPGGAAAGTTPAGPKQLAVRTPDRIVTLNAGGDETGSYAIPEELQRQAFAFSLLNDGSAIAVYSGVNEKSERMSQSIVFFDASGEIVRRAEDVASQYPIPSSTIRSLAYAVLLPSVLAAIFLVGFVLPMQSLTMGESAGYGSALAASMAEAWPALVMTLAIGALAAAEAVRPPGSAGVDRVRVSFWSAGARGILLASPLAGAVALPDVRHKRSPRPRCVL